MWPFKNKDPYEKLKGLKKIKIEGMSFTIKRLNPLLDFSSDNIPQIFTDFSSIKPPPSADSSPSVLNKIKDDMFSIIKAGVVEPKLSKDGITVDDLFRDPDIGIGLYQAILDHSLNRFKGLKKLFFSIKTKYKSYITWRKATGHYRAAFYSRVRTLRSTNAS